MELLLLSLCFSSISQDDSVNQALFEQILTTIVISSLWGISWKSLQSYPDWAEKYVDNHIIDKKNYFKWYQGNIWYFPHDNNFHMFFAFSKGFSVDQWLLRKRFKVDDVTGMQHENTREPGLVADTMVFCLVSCHAKSFYYL